MSNFLTRFTKSKLGNKFLLLFVLIASVPLLVLGSVSLYLIDQSHRIDVANLQTQLIREHEEKISAFIGETLDTMRLRVSVSDVEGSVTSTSWQEFLANGLLENKSFEAVSFVSTSGTEKVYRSRDEKRSVRGTNMSELPEFQATQSGDTYIGEIYQTIDGPRAIMAAPIQIENRVVQIIIAEINLSDIFGQIKKARLGSMGYLLLFDKNGSYVAGGESSSVEFGENFSDRERLLRLKSGEILGGLGKEDRYKGYFSDSIVVGTASVVPDTGWILMTEWPIEDADMVVSAIRGQIFTVTLLSVLIVFVLAYSFSEHLIRPIRLLQKGTSEIEKGNFENKVVIKTDDELEDLGDSFNKMTKGLKRLEELKNEFVFIAAHELRAPVTAIRGYLSMIKEGAGGAMSKKMEELFSPAWQSNERLVGLINNLLEIARSEAGKIKIEVLPDSIEDSVTAIINEAKVLADEKNIKITYDKDEAVPKVDMDPSRVKEVLMNFVSNAIKYNNDGGFVKIYHKIGEGAVVTHVEDNGFGLSDEDQKHMFEKFFRSDSEDNKNIQGTGLGMFITKELIEKMGGKVWFRSEKEKGSRFSFSLPISKNKN